MRKRLLALAMVSMLALGIIPTNGCPSPADKDTRQASPEFAFDHYHYYEEFKSELERISVEHPDITQKITLGRTWEGREIMALRVTDRPAEEEADEPDILVMGAHHAYELPSAEVPMYILEYLAENYAVNSTVRGMVDSRDIWFVPLVNPDGREYSMNYDLDWRKNRRPIDLDGNGVPEGIGADLNRNYGHLWSQQGTSTDPASSNYCGPYAFSENETNAIQQLALAQGFDLSLSYHTYGEQVTYPWNNGIDTLNPRGSILQAIAADMAGSMGYVSFEGINLYPTTGDSDDWLYSEFSTLPFTVELGTQRNVPESGILALCQKNLGAALYAIDVASEPEKALLPDWTVMVYMSADADPALANEALIDLNEMETAGSTASVNILALYDGRGTGDSAIYRIERDAGGLNSAIISPTVDDLGAVIDPVSRELDMSKPATLRNFTAWAMQNYPAQKYLLVFWGHGDGVLQQFVPDKGVGMKVNDIRPALSGVELDIVGFDTCSLGHFEVATELVGIADIMIGSEAKEPLAGWDYQATLGRLVLAPGTGPRALAWHIISDYLAANPENYLTQAAIDVDVYHERFLPALNDFANVSLDFSYLDYSKIWNARNITNTFVAQQDAVDLFQFLGKLKSQEVSDPVMDRIERLLALKDEMVFAYGTGTAFPDCTAMAVYFPLLAAAVPSDYLSLGFCVNRWDEYLEGTKAPASRPVLDPGTPPGANTTLGPYNVTAAATGYGGESVELLYRVSGGHWLSLAMGYADGMLSAGIPGQVNGSTVEYYFRDATNNIPEPYDIKWGGTDYLSFSVSASCDFAVTGISALILEDLPEGFAEGKKVMILVNCSNSGPEPVTANITLLNERPGDYVLYTMQATINAGEWQILAMNVSLKTGTTKIKAFAEQTAVFDRNVSNQNATIWVNVSASGIADNDFIAEYGYMILGLTVLWGISMAYIAHRLRKARRRRREAAAQSIRAARDFVATAAEFGGNVAAANVLLARAEAALARKALPECEKLVRRARESAMEAVGQKEGQP